MISNLYALLFIILIILSLFYIVSIFFLKKYVSKNERLNTFSIEDTKEWIDLIVSECKKQDKNIQSIIGINRGGILVGAYVGIKLGIKDNSIIRCSVARNSDKVNFLGGNFDCLKEGNVLLIDDVCRSGTSFMVANAY